MIYISFCNVLLNRVPGNRALCHSCVLDLSKEPLSIQVPEFLLMESSPYCPKHR